MVKLLLRPQSQHNQHKYAQLHQIFVHICAGSASQLSWFVPLWGDQPGSEQPETATLKFELLNRVEKRPGPTNTCRFMINIRTEPLKLLFSDTSLEEVFALTKKRPGSHHMLVCKVSSQNAKPISSRCLLHTHLQRWPPPRWAQWRFFFWDLGIPCSLFLSLNLPAGLPPVVSGAAVTPVMEGRAQRTHG